MAYYLVKAKYQNDLLEELRKRLDSGEIRKMKPFGSALQYGLENARLDLQEPGGAVWEEEDYCSPPLAQERAAVLDTYFVDLKVEPVLEGTGWERIKSLPRLWKAGLETFMRYKLLGRSGLRVSELCLGTMTFGDDWGWGTPKDESRRIFDAFVEAGGNFIDTANNYTNGTSEKFVGEFVQGDRDHFVVATKYTLSERETDPNFGGNHRKNMRRSVEGSLQRLGTDHIDLLYLHMWDAMTPVEEVMRGLDDLVRAGKILYAGISDTPAWVVSQANMLADLRGWSRFVAFQGEYSLASRAPERDLLPMTNATDMTFMAWGVLEAGEMTGKYNLPSSEPRRSKDTNERIKAIAVVLMEIAKEIGRTPSQVAINWARQGPYHIIPMLGARSVKQLMDNLGCLDFELTHEHMVRLDDASPIDLGFPHSFLGSDHVRSLIFGKTFNQIVTAAK